VFTPEEINQLAEDRTAVTDLVSFSLSRSLGPKWQIALDTSATRSSGTPASGGVPPTPDTGTEIAFQAQVSGSGLWRANDLYVFTMRHQQSDLQTLQSAAVSLRLPLWGAWRIGPRLRFDRLQSKANGTDRDALYPTLRVDYQRGRSLFEMEGGEEISRSTPAPVTGDTRRRYFMLGYRVGF
jgi:hypothetical protein